MTQRPRDETIEVSDISTENRYQLCSLNTEIMAYPSPKKPDIPSLEEQIFNIIVRHQMVEIINHMKYIENRVIKGLACNAGNNIKYFQGPPGCGKSCVLYAMLQYAKVNNWLVVYVPNLKINSDNPNEFMNDFISSFIDPKNNTRELIDSLSNPVLGQSSTYEMLTDLKLTITERFDDLLTRIRIYKASKPIFLAIDQWNALFELPLDNPIRKRWDNLSRLIVKYGFSMVALSSSFVKPDKAFNDGQIVENFIVMEPYNSEETTTILRYLRNNQLIPPEEILSNEEIKRISGNIPRLIRTIQETYILRGRWDIEMYNKLGMEYYDQRINKHLDTANETNNKEDSRTTFKLALDLFVNDIITDIESPFWRNSGMFDEQGKPMCSIITKSFNHCLSNQTTQVIDILGQVPSYRGALFEMLLIYKFQRDIGRDIQFIGSKFTDTVSDVNAPKNDIEMTHILVNRPALGELIRQTKEEHIERYPENTLIICFPNHALIDFVIYTNKKLYFIQVSLSSYEKHSRKDNRCTKILNGIGKQNGSRIYAELQNKTIQQYYMERSPYQNQVERAKLAHTKLQHITTSGLIYLYVTIDNNKYDRREPDVLEQGWTVRLSGQQLRNLLGPDNIDHLLGINDK